MMKFICRIFLVLSMSFALPAIAQQKVTGTVTDDLGETVIGASVFVEGTTIGSITDLDGKYAVSVPDDLMDGVMVFSFIGYTTQKIPIAGKSVIDVQMMLDDQQLDEVVVVGYNTQIKRDVTGAMATVSGKQLAALPVAGVDQALQGRAPGVNIAQVTGAPGAGVAVRIRGVGSLNSSNDPLYVVDGVPTREVFNMLSPQDIDEITVLKDASAAAIYGSRANNGVVLITTKKGRKNEQKITINSQVGVQVHGRLTKMANRDEYVNVYNQAASNDNAFVTDDLFKRELISKSFADTLPDVNYLNRLFRKAAIQSYGLTASGGSDKTQYLMSVTYFGQQGIIQGSDYDRVTGRINLRTEVKKWFTTGVNLNIARAHTSLIGSSGDGAGGNGGSVVRYAYFRTPAIPVYDKSGNYVDLPSRPDFFGDGYNPIGLANYFNNKKTTDRYFGRLFSILTFAPNLTLTSNLGFDSEHNLQRRFDRNWGTNDRINNPNRLTITNSNTIAWTMNHVLQYNKKIGDHSFSGLVGVEAIRTQGYAANASGMNFPDQNPNLTYLGNGQRTPTVSESKYAFTLLSFFSKIDYKYKDKYQIGGSFRRDGSSRFASQNKWGNFYAVSGGWSLDREAFLSDVSFITQLKLRAGYGVIGNQAIGNYAYSDQLQPKYNYPFTSTPSDGYAITQLGNNQVKWESSKQFNAGIDFELNKGIIYGSLDFYNKLTSDMLVKQPNPPSVGYASPSWVNNGEILNQGIELQLGVQKTIRDFGFNITGNGAIIHNEVKKFNGFLPAGTIGSGNYVTRSEVGYPVGSFYMYEMAGIFQSQLDITTSAYQGNNIHPGDVKYKDLNGDGVINEKDRAHVGSPIPKFTGGLNIGLNYKNFDMTLFFQGAYGFNIYNVAYMDIEGFYRPFNVTKAYADNYWNGEGSTNTYPRPSWSSSNNNVKISTRFMYNGSYTRLKNFQLGYNFSQAACDKLKLTSLRIYTSIQNLLTFTKYPGLDPEMTTSNNSTSEGDKAKGIDWGTYPSARSFNIGVNLSF